MNFWKTNVDSGVNNTPFLAGFQGVMDSPNHLSNNSAEYNSDSHNSDLPDAQKTSSTISKNTLLAKKRLQAYCAGSKQKQSSSKEQKNKPVHCEKKLDLKKTYTVLNPEESTTKPLQVPKKSKFEYNIADVPIDQIPPVAIHQIKVDSPALGHRSDTDEDNLFKKREIRCKNIRRSELMLRKSTSPASEPEKMINDDVSNVKEDHQKNSTESKQRENTHKDFTIKSTVKQLKEQRFDFKCYFNFESPSPPLDSYKVQSRSREHYRVQFPCLRQTATKPHILYSANPRVAPYGSLSRKQLFAMVPKERAALIEALWAPSNCETDSKLSTTRQWYSRNWKKTDTSEAKLLESSIGLSFLQSYSDEYEVDASATNRDAVTESDKKEHFTPPTVEKEDNDTWDIPILYKTPPQTDGEEAKLSESEEKCAPTVNASVKSSASSEGIKEKKKKKIDSKKGKLKSPKKRSKKKSAKDESDSEDSAAAKRASKQKKKKKEKSKSHKSKRKNKKRKSKKRESSDQDDTSDDDATKAADGRAMNKKIETSHRNGNNFLNSSEYDDDIRYFADRFNAELMLKGKDKHKAKINFTLDDLGVTMLEKLSETKPNETAQKEETKVDLLKLNENYLKEQKKLEEDTTKVHGKTEEEAPEDSTANVNNEPDWESIRNKRKRKAETELEKTASIVREIDVPLATIKQELDDSDPPKTSWEEFMNFRPIDLEIPLNIKPFVRREIKIEPDVFDVESAVAATPIPEEIPPETPPKIKVEQPDSVENVDLTLQNEYEEFLKAVSTNEEDKRSEQSIVIDSSSSNSSKNEDDTMEANEEPDKLPPGPVPSPKLDTIFDPINVCAEAPSAPPTVDLPKSSVELLSNVMPVTINAAATSGDESIINGEEQPLDGEKLVFTLPAKKLLDNSQLNLNDSDDDHDQSTDKEAEKKVVETTEKQLRKQQRSPKQSIRNRDHHHHRPPSPKRSRKSAQQKQRRSSSVGRKMSPLPQQSNRGGNGRRRRSSPINRMSPQRRFGRGRSPPPPASRRRRRSVTPPSRRRPNNSPASRRGSDRRTKSPPPSAQKRESSPLKRSSVADSTISDDQLQQQDEQRSPKRLSLDERIGAALGGGYAENEDYVHYQQHEQQQQQHAYRYDAAVLTHAHMVVPPPQNVYKQVGNMLQIVPTENLMEIPVPHPHPHPSPQDRCGGVTFAGYGAYSQMSKLPSPNVPEQRTKFVQVGNMLQIVPTDMNPDDIATNPSDIQIKLEQTDDISMDMSVIGGSEKTSAEAAMLQKAAERRAERELRRKERERRRKEKERRRKEKEKLRQAKLKAKTEIMIKKALELEVEDDDLEADNWTSQSIQWPPPSLSSCHTPSKEAGKSILLNNRRLLRESESEERKGKNVKFADGVRPGEGTSPSAGEELTSPPPPSKKKLPKEKRFKKLRLDKAIAKKKKVKVKVIKREAPPSEESDTDENLPPPSPPPGSPPPHVFPPRIKLNAVNSHVTAVPPASYLGSMMTATPPVPTQPPLSGPFPPANLYRPTINLIMPSIPSGHLSSVPAHVQSPHVTVSPHYVSGLAAPPPPPPPPPSSTSSSSHSSHSRHY